MYESEMDHTKMFQKDLHAYQDQDDAACNLCLCLKPRSKFASDQNANK